MPRRKRHSPRSPKPRRTPKLRLHKPTGQALVEIDGQRIYLGRFGQPETTERYHRLIAEWLACGRRLPVPADDITIVELIDRFYVHAKQYYRKPDGTPTSELGNLRLALQPLKDLYGNTRAAEFGPRGFKTVRERMVQAGGARRYINRHMSRVKRLFRWGVAEELVPPGVYEALKAVPGLKRGRTEVPSISADSASSRNCSRNRLTTCTPRMSRTVHNEPGSLFTNSDRTGKDHAAWLAGCSEPVAGNIGART